MTQVLLNAGPSERGWHSFESAARCMRLWAWENVKKASFPMSDPLVRGSLLHIGLAHYYMRKMVDDPGTYYSPEDSVRVLARKEADQANGFEGELWVKWVDPVLVMLEKYIEQYEDCSWKPIAVEQELRATIPLPGGEPFLFTQRADLIVEDSWGFKWIVDHKTAYRLTNKTLRQYILSGQFLGYQVFGRKMYGKKFGGVVLNRIKSSSPHEFDRCSIEPAPAAVAGFVPALQSIERRIRTHNQSNDPMDYPPVFSEQACYGKYGPCPAFELCRWGDTDG